MKLALAILSILSAIAAVTAVDIRGFRNYGCWGPQYICHNIPSNACCRFSRVVRSMRWTLPTGTRGTGHVLRSCQWSYSPVYGPRYNSCFNYLGLGVRSGRWQQGICVWTYRRSVLDERQTDDAVCPADEICQDPDVLVYTDKDGSNRTATIPEGMLEKVDEMVDNNDYAGLATLPDFKNATLDTLPSVDLYELPETKDGEVV